jgi:hypothetical protein
MFLQKVLLSLNSCNRSLNACIVLKKIIEELVMDKFASFAQVLENPFLALQFRQDAQERQVILAENGFDAEESQAVCDGITADDENQISELFGYGQGNYILAIIVIDAMTLHSDNVCAVAK